LVRAQHDAVYHTSLSISIEIVSWLERGIKLGSDIKEVINNIIS
jgi:hypothetical protein